MNDIVKHTENFFKEIDETLNRVEQQGFCTCGSKNYVKLLEKHKTHLIEIRYFWKNLSLLDPREGYQEIHHAPEFLEDSLRNFLKSLLDKYLPLENDPKVIVKEKKVEVLKTVYIHDNVRLAHELMLGFCKAQNIPDALAIYHEEADKNNNVFACNALGQLYYEGVLIPRDINKAKLYYEKSAASKNPEGIYYKGVLYEKGFLLAENRMDKAIECYEEAAGLGCLDALTDLAYICQHGFVDPATNTYLYEPNMYLAFEKYKTAVKNNFPRALNNFGLLLASSNHMEKFKGENQRKSFKCFEQASNLGYIKALFNLATAYEKGIGVKVDLTKAISLYKEAAYKGDPIAKLYFAYHTLKRVLSEENEYEAVLSESIRFMLELIYLMPELPEPYYYLALLYEHGFCVTRDLKVALSYYIQAATLGHAASMSKIGDFYHSGMGGLLKNQQLAVKYYREAAELGNAEAIINLGTIYEEGAYGDLERDYKKAAEYYELATKLGDSRGFLNLGYMHEKGRFFEKSRDKAQEFYQIAAEKGDSHSKKILKIQNNGNNYYSAIKIQPPENKNLFGHESIMRSGIMPQFVEKCAKINIRKGEFNVVNKYERLEKS